jgi:chromosomal replication initiator protein
MQSSVVRQASGGLPIGTIAGAGERMTETTGSGETGRAASASGQAIFDRVMTQIKLRLGADVFNSWFGRMKLDDDAPSVARLSVPTAFLRSWINGHYLDLIAELWRKEEPRLLRLEIVVRSATRQVRTNEPVAVVEGRRPQKPQHAVPGSTVPLATLKTEKQASRPSNDGEPRQQVIGSPLDSRYTFESFVDGPSNRVAFAAARAVAESHASAMRFNPLFLHASVGLGKTHLLQAVAAEAVRLNPRARVIYLTAEYFMWRFATAIRDNNALTLKEQLRDIDLLIIDDMQFLQGKMIQHEFCHLINMLLGQRQAGRRRRRPAAIRTGIAGTARAFASQWRRGA